MPKIPFIYARFPDPNDTVHSIERRLKQHLQQLRAAAAEGEQAASDEPGDSLTWMDEPQAASLDRTDIERISRRANGLFERRLAASGLNHLSRDDRKALAVLRHGVSLSPIASESRADEIASMLHADMPWMAPATTHLWHGMRRSAHRGDMGFRLAPLLLCGPPGIGKSVWARRVGAALDLPVRIIEASGEQASFGVVGSQRGWGSAHPGKPLQTILQRLVGNPIIVVDEIEKAGDVTSTRNARYSLTEGVLPLIEPGTAKDWECPYYQVRFDMSWISWIFTANSTTSLPEPFLSRVEVIRLEGPSSEELVDFVVREGSRRGLKQTAIDAVTMAIKALAARGHRLNLRTVGRMLNRAEVMQHMPRRH